MRALPRLLHFALACDACGLGGTLAQADAIDGDWCKDAASFQINGPHIRTPGGQQATGDYHRHGFHYVVPQGETDAGAEIAMRLLNETTVELMRREGATDGKPEIWQRCQPIS